MYTHFCHLAWHAYLGLGPCLSMTLQMWCLFYERLLRKLSLERFAQQRQQCARKLTKSIWNMMSDSWMPLPKEFEARTWGRLNALLPQTREFYFGPESICITSCIVGIAEVPRGRTLDSSVLSSRCVESNCGYSIGQIGELLGKNTEACWICNCWKQTSCTGHGTKVVPLSLSSWKVQVLTNQRPHCHGPSFM